MGSLVMVVEDDEQIRETLTEILEYHGYDALAVSHGREALDQLAAGARPALILLDLMMPVMDGQEFRAEQLKQRELASIPVVVISAFRDLREAVREMRPSAVLHKPVDLSELLQVIEHFAGAATIAR